MSDVKQQLLDAALIHVAFDGWSDATYHAAVKDAEIDAGRCASCLSAWRG